MNQSDLPPPGGTMTVTLGLDRKVKVPMWDEDALRAYAAASVRAERKRIIQFLQEMQRVVGDAHNHYGVAAMRIRERV